MLIGSFLIAFVMKYRMKHREVRYRKLTDIKLFFKRKKKKKKVEGSTLV